MRCHHPRRRRRRRRAAARRHRRHRGPAPQQGAQQQRRRPAEEERRLHSVDGLVWGVGRVELGGCKRKYKEAKHTEHERVNSRVWRALLGCWASGAEAEAVQAALQGTLHHPRIDSTRSIATRCRRRVWWNPGVDRNRGRTRRPRPWLQPLESNAPTTDARLRQHHSPLTPHHHDPTTLHPTGSIDRAAAKASKRGQAGAMSDSGSISSASRKRPAAAMNKCVRRLLGGMCVGG